MATMTLLTAKYSNSKNQRVVFGGTFRQSNNGLFNKLYFSFLSSVDQRIDR